VAHEATGPRLPGSCPSVHPSSTARRAGTARGEDLPDRDDLQQPADADDLFNPEKYPEDRALAQGLREHGYVVGQNLMVEAGPVKGKHAGLEAFAAELVRPKVDLIYLYSCGRRLHVARQATSTIPIVVGACNDDLVASGIIKSLARPGGNITGISKLTPELTAKRLELLKEVLPKPRGWRSCGTPTIRTSQATGERCRTPPKRWA
jgi:ABC transporter substrate binding protein